MAVRDVSARDSEHEDAEAHGLVESMEDSVDDLVAGLVVRLRTLEEQPERNGRAFGEGFDRPALSEVALDFFQNLFRPREFDLERGATLDPFHDDLVGADDEFDRERVDEPGSQENFGARL